MLRRMPLRRLVVASCLIGTGACKDAPPTPAAELTPQARQQQECERFATDMARTGLIAGQVLVTALDDDPASAERGRAEMKQGAQQMRRALYDRCMTWPEDVMQCLPPLGTLKDGCEEKVLAAMEGATPPPKDVPPGPAPAWRVALPSQPQHVAMSLDGTALVVTSEGLLGVRDGAIAWRKEGRYGAWLVPLPVEPATWVAGVEDRVVGLDPADGRERWQARLPPIEGEPIEGEPVEGEPIEGEPGEDGDGLGGLGGLGEKALVRHAAWHADGLLVGDAEARLLRVSPARCAAPEAARGAAPEASRRPAPRAARGATPEACITVVGRLPDEVLEEEARLLVDAKGRRYLWESGVVRALSDDWRTLMTARAHDTLSHVTVDGERLVLLVDDEVVELDPTQCRGEAPFAPSQWPQPGVMFVRDADECSDCEAPPPGCRRSRVFLDGLTSEAPALTRDGAVVVHHDGYTLALHDGAPRWKASTGGGGPLVSDGSRVLGFSTGLREGDPPGVIELGASDGALRWLTPLPVEVGDLYFGSDIHLALGGPWLAVAYQQTLLVLPLPPAA